MKPFWPTLVSLLLLLGPMVRAEQKSGETFTDPTYGYSFIYPDYWILKSDQPTVDRLIGGGGDKPAKSDGPMKFRFVLFARDKSSPPSGSNLVLGVVQYKKQEMDPEAMLKGAGEGLGDENSTLEGPDTVQIAGHDFSRFVLKPKPPASPGKTSADFQEHYLFIDQEQFRLYDFTITTDPGSPDLAPLENVVKSLRFK